jgi:hypothetical protein
MMEAEIASETFVINCKFSQLITQKGLNTKILTSSQLVKKFTPSYEISRYCLPKNPPLASFCTPPPPLHFFRMHLNIIFPTA